MRVQHNIPAINAYRQLGVNTNATSKALEKLSSGYRINKAGDDAAGLAISEKMRSQISGLGMAEKNSQDGISLIQTAEGGLQETHSILQRMRELAVQASNGTYQDSDRANLDNEIQALKGEINKISTSADFNGIKLLSGNLNNFDASKVSAIAGGVTITFMSNTGTAYANVSISVGTNADATWVGDNVLELTLVNSETYTESDIMTLINTASSINGTTPWKTNDIFIKLSEDWVFNGTTHVNAGHQTVGTAPVMQDLEFQIGANGANDQRVSLSVNGIGAAGLGIIDTDILTANNAKMAITTIDKAVGIVSKQRAELGALQNRLEHTINNLGVTKENLTAAESRVRDTDMASEMMNFTKMNILGQAAQSMLAQANAQPQQILQLLQG